MQASDELSQAKELLEAERSKSEAAEQARATLAADLDLIKKQLDMEQDNIEKCKRFLEPEDLAKIVDEKSSSPSSLEQGLTISEKILLKYKRSNDLREFFETCYQSQNRQVKEHLKKIGVLEETISAK